MPAPAGHDTHECWLESYQRPAGRSGWGGGGWVGGWVAVVIGGVEKHARERTKQRTPSTHNTRDGGGGRRRRSGKRTLIDAVVVDEVRVVEVQEVVARGVLSAVA